MAEQCTDTFVRIAEALGDFSCRDAPAIVHVRNPADLSNWTLPVIELLMVTVAVAALLHSIRRLRRDGDPTNLVLWFATVVYLFVIEIPLYFPNVFGIEDTLGVVFVHNVFTVQFLFDRLPLYIVALYPAVVTLAYEIVRSFGVIRDRGILLGAICVGFVHHCLYEVFDQLGPQLRWWGWNPDNALNAPMLATVPMTSMFIFATLGPIVVTTLVLLMLRRAPRTGGALAWRILLAGALTPLGLVLLSIPTSLIGVEQPKPFAQVVLFSVELAAVAVVAVLTLAQQWARIRSGAIDPAGASRFVRVLGPLYLVALGILWLTANSEDSTPVGSVPYAVAAFVGAALCIAGALTATQRAPAQVTRQPV